jgi:hypothetical protein
MGGLTSSFFLLAESVSETFPVVSSQCVRESDSYLMSVLMYPAVSADFGLFILLRYGLQFASRFLFYSLLFIFADIYIAVPAEAVSAESTVLVAP